MLKKNIIIISLIFFLTNCGFTPIYLGNNNINFSIEQINFTGDRELNNYFKIHLKKYKNDETDKKFFIEAESRYEKVILSKDQTGKVSNYQLEAEVIFTIKPNNKKIKFFEKKIMDSMDDRFEEVKYEKSVKQNFAISISKRLASELIIN